MSIERVRGQPSRFVALDEIGSFTCECPSCFRLRGSTAEANVRLADAGGHVGRMLANDRLRAADDGSGRGDLRPV